MDLKNVTIVIVVKDKTTDQTIQFVPKYVVTPSSYYSQSLKKNDNISLDITLYEKNELNIRIFDGTFLLNGRKNKTSLVSCDNIQKAKKGETLKIICYLSSDVDKSLYNLERNINGKLEGREPLVNGTIH